LHLRRRRFERGELRREFYGGGADQLVSQLVLVAAVVAWVAMTCGILFFVIKKTIGLRVAADEEHMGLDVLEHGVRGYNQEIYTADFVLETDGQKVPVGTFVNDA
jgi:ammonia channel protein AmtB